MTFLETLRQSLFGPSRPELPDHSLDNTETDDSEVIDVTPPKKRKGYGIQDAVELMRKLPLDDNPQLVMTVIKSTLESAQVLVSDIIQDAIDRLREIENRVSTLHNEIADLEAKIESRRAEIARLEYDHAEVTTVKAQLEFAERQAAAEQQQPPESYEPAPAE